MYKQHVLRVSYLFCVFCCFCFHLLYRLHWRPQQCGGWNDFLHLHLHFMFGLVCGGFRCCYRASPPPPFTSSFVVGYFVIRCCRWCFCCLLYCRCCCCCHLIRCNIFVATTIQRSVLLLALPFVLPPSIRTPSSYSCAFMQQQHRRTNNCSFRRLHTNEWIRRWWRLDFCLFTKFSFRM